jgi:hypothetical protein
MTGFYGKVVFLLLTQEGFTTEKERRKCLSRMQDKKVYLSKTWKIVTLSGVRPAATAQQLR